MALDKKIYYISPDTPFVFLDCVEAFNNLDDKEKRYTHHLSRASWKGALICLLQTSPESAGLFLLFQRIFRKQSIEEFKTLAQNEGFSEEEVKATIAYIASVYGNMGNYRSFGDTKFFPDVPKEKFVKLIKETAAYKECETTREIWSRVGEALFSDNPELLQLGLGTGGLSTYYSSNCDKGDAESVQKFLDAKDISPYNTRLISRQEGGKTSYVIRQAAAESKNVTEGSCMDRNNSQANVVVEAGDYAALMASMVEELELAKENALNDDEKAMLAEYIKSFSQGSIEAHKDGSRHWIKDKGPTVEGYIGFIESYRDPYGVRGEFEGFVAVVNKEMSAKFQELVNRAEVLLLKMPWDQSYEKDKFLRPDFTSLDIVSFGSSGVPAGINIPNYDDIRQNEGFKNVSLGNVLKSRFKDPKVTFLSEEDRVRYVEHVADAFEVQVGLHELLGHGSGKLFRKDADGKLNVDKDTVPNVVTGGQGITSWYEHGQTWDSVFTALASPYEECRAECVGLYLCSQPEVLKTFGLEGDCAKDIVYINWLSMVRSGLLSLEMFTPTQRTWRQAHCQARYVILQVLIEAGQDFVKVQEVTAADGNPDLLISMDESKIESVGVPAIGAFLQKLQYYKSTADITGGSKMFNNYSSVSPHFEHLRALVISRKKPRQEVLQCNTELQGGSVTLKTYESTAEGMIQSFQDRFAGGQLEAELLALWKKDLQDLGF